MIREFGDSAEPELENILVSDTPVPSAQGIWEQERRKTVSGTNIRFGLVLHNSMATNSKQHREKEPLTN